MKRRENSFSASRASGLGLVVICFSILIFNLYHLRLMNTTTTPPFDANDIKMLPVAPTRGIIYDRNGIPLVKNVTGTILLRL